MQSILRQATRFMTLSRWQRAQLGAEPAANPDTTKVRHLPKELRNRKNSLSNSKIPSAPRTPRKMSTPSAIATSAKASISIRSRKKSRSARASPRKSKRSSKLIDDPVVTEYVNRVGQNLVRNSDARVPFTIKVIDSDEVNAFALPGGFFYVNSGLILRAQEESELAGVMAHEISHVTARHGTKNATKGEMMQLATIPSDALRSCRLGRLWLYEGLNIAIPLTYLKFSRDSEREADFLGLQYMYKAGYDPNAFVTFFERIQADEKRRPGTIPKVFSTHPPTPDRIEAAQKEIARILPNKPEYIVTTSEFDSVKARLRNIMFARKVQDNQPGKPSLRTRTEQQQKGTQQQDPNANPDDDRPTLKRRPDSQ